jgi:2'-5' RNA ligase
MRVFAALELPPGVREGIAGAFSKARSLASKAKWVAAEAMHLTLHFFGEIPDAEIGGFSPVFDDPALCIPAIRAQLGAAGFFPGGGPPRVLWVGLAKGEEEMRAFWNRLTESLQALRGDGGPLRNWSPDSRGFSPHVTVARAGTVPLSRHWADEAVVPSAEFLIERCVLFQSLLGPAGARYVPLKTISFQGGAV